VSIRNLEYMFRPRSIAVIGASQRPHSVGAVLARNLLTANFGGPIMPVNPRHQAVAGVLAYPDVASLPVVPDLAIIATPPSTAAPLIAELGARGTRAAVVISAGFGETGQDSGKRLQSDILNAARRHMLRIIGPNCLGIMVPGAGVNASFGHVEPLAGDLAFATQSGAIVTAVLDWAHGRGIGFSHLVSLGDMVDVDFGDVLDYLANDDGTRAILLYIEAVTNARKFMSAARAAARTKPVIVVKAGRSQEGRTAAASHTGAISGPDAVYDAVIRRAGMLRVHTLEQLFDATEALAANLRLRGERVAIVTNGGGVGVLATDALVAAGGILAELSEQTRAALDRCLPATWSRGNPVDIIGDAPGSRYAAALAVLGEDSGVDALLVLNCPTGVASSAEAAEAVVGAVRDLRRKLPVVTSWVGNGYAGAARRLLSNAGVPSYPTPEQAVRALMYLSDYRRNQEILTETPPSLPVEFTPDRARARAIIDGALARGDQWLTATEAIELISAYGIASVATHAATSPQGAAELADRLGGAVALKILSPDVLHKSDVGGVALGIMGPAAVRKAAEAMVRRLESERPDAAVAGFVVQPMVARPGAYELFVGVTSDPQFGPVLAFGQGGTAVEVIDDLALALPPLNLHLAREAMRRTQIARRLRGYRDVPPVNIDAVATVLVRTSQLVVELPEVVELDVNPLLADEFGTIAVDARVRVAPPVGRPTDRLAIRPYPSELEQEVELGDGRRLFLRPIVPEDEPSLHATFSDLTAEEIRMRFFIPMKTMSHMMAARFTQIDYDREMGLVLTEKGSFGTTPLYGIASVAADPDNQKAEFAIIVHHSMTGMGLGVMLLQTLIDYAQSRGIGELSGDVLRDNEEMRALARTLGFSEQDTDDHGVIKVVRALRPPSRAEPSRAEPPSPA
jgi:acetyltransferase